MEKKTEENVKVAKYEEVSVNNKPSNKLKYVFVFLLGMIVTIGLFSFINNVFVEDSNLRVKISDNGISAGVNKIYDATVYIENYKDKKVVA